MTNVKPGDLARTVSPARAPGAIGVVLADGSHSDFLTPPELAYAVSKYGPLWVVEFARPYPWTHVRSQDVNLCIGIIPDAWLRLVSGLDTRPHIVRTTEDVEKFAESDGRFTI